MVCLTGDSSPDAQAVELSAESQHIRVRDAGRSRCSTRIRREFQCFRSKRPEKPAFVSKIFAAVADFHKRSFSHPGVLVYESHADCAGDSANAELGSGAIAAFD